MYFTLKDSDGSVRAVMFKSQASYLKFLPEEGMKVICRASVSIYEKDGQYQLYVGDMQPDGAGSILVAFEQLKTKLAAEGLFDKSLKKPLPKFPKKIAVITSNTGAAVHDMINVLSRRFPLATLIMCPVSVQGENAPPQMIKAIQDVCEFTDADIIIIGRGGGSQEDLWCFNDEQLARTVAAATVPVISAVGHETDFTICDFAADFRAPTPSAAAEIAVPDINEISSKILQYESRMNIAVNSRIKNLTERIKFLTQSFESKSITELTEHNYLRLDGLFARLSNAYGELNHKSSEKYTSLLAKLDALDPIKILKRGYAVAEINGNTVSSVNDINEFDQIKLKLYDGSAKCQILEIERN
jgi:exodeoxyribonuclease VII large subunit